MNCLPERSDLDQSQPALMCYWTEAKQVFFFVLFCFSCLSVTEHQGAGRGGCRVKGTQGPKRPKGPASPLQSTVSDVEQGRAGHCAMTRKLIRL